MIDRQEILEFAREFSLRPNVVEKDYALGWLLAGIGNHSATKDSWIFKGGTCLKKCYFETYRFSEDLDFTLTDVAHIDEVFLLSIFKEITEWVYEQSGIELPPETIRFEVYQNPRGKQSVLGRIGYRGPIAPRGDLPRIKLDLTNDEAVILAPVIREVHHVYSDRPAGGIQALCYSYEEVFSEKVRALSERGLPRDLYDVVHLFRHPEMRPDREVVSQVIRKKCEFKSIPFPSLESIRSDPQKAELDGEWANMLAHQLPMLPSVNQFWEELSHVFDWLLRGAVPVQPQPVAMLPEEDAQWTAPATAQAWGMRVPLEIIRFAGANHLCVKLGYQGSLRTIEPYSLRRTKEGNLLLHAIRTDNREPRAYRVDKIESAEVIQQTFTPVYAVELTPSGPIQAPPQTRSSSGFGLRPRPSRPLRRRKASLSPSLKYIVRCATCDKQFTRSSLDTTLKEHKNRNGYPCYGRYGQYVGTKYA